MIRLIPLVAAFLMAAITVYILALVSAKAEPQLATIKPVPIIPPAQYDYPYKGAIKMQRVKAVAELRKLCDNTSSIACARFSMPRLADGSSASCTIIMLPNETIIASGYDPAVVMRHEHAHCNGWGKDHPMPTTPQKTAAMPDEAAKDRQIAATLKRCLAERSDDSWKKTHTQKELTEFCSCFAVRSAPDNADVPKELAYCGKYLNLPDISNIKKKAW